MAQPHDLKLPNSSSLEPPRARTILMTHPHGRASARWPWCVRALALGALGLATGRAACPSYSGRAPARAHLSMFLGPHLRARPRDVSSMSRRGKQADADDATPSRVRCSRNSSRGRDEGFPANRLNHQVHFDRWKGLENRDIVHEKIIRLDGNEDRIFRERLLGLGWGFMYEDLVHINVTMVREFCANSSSRKQEYVFLRGKKIPFTEANIHHNLFLCMH
ncbi:hypothetical protein PIB30_062366 [Stylosanthes scabra]|uniref:Uncharacterized protein n=1 Tax=Stylosanthes scabra TaxID=79078 RepID=A0ABU6SMF8_9FABA|nr:hypothetical protein [Stylosanthes scabra]